MCLLCSPRRRTQQRYAWAFISGKQKEGKAGGMAVKASEENKRAPASFLLNWKGDAAEISTCFRKRVIIGLNSRFFLNWCAPRLVSRLFPKSCETAHTHSEFLKPLLNIPVVLNLLASSWKNLEPSDPQINWYILIFTSEKSSRITETACPKLWGRTPFR